MTSENSTSLPSNKLTKSNGAKIKVLHIIASPVIGGAEKLLLTLFRKLDTEKFDVVLGIFIYKEGGKNLVWKEAARLGLTLEPIRFMNPYDLIQILRLLRIVKRHHPDIIHTHGYKTNILGFLVAKIFGIPIVTTVHGLYPNKTKTELFVRLSLILLRHFDMIIAVSDQIRAELKNLKIPLNKVTTIRNVPSISSKEYSASVSTFREEVGIPANSKIIGFVGRLEKVKGCEYAIQALSEMLRINPDFFLVIVGEGSERKSLGLLVRKLGLKDHVHFCGFRDDIQKVFQSLDFYVLPSLNEGIPLTILEAMYLGVPVFATCVGGLPEVIKNKVNGILVPPKSPEALAESILESLSNPNEMAKRVIEARKTILNQYNIKNWIERIQNIYSGVSGKGTGSKWVEQSDNVK